MMSLLLVCLTFVVQCCGVNGGWTPDTLSDGMAQVGPMLGATHGKEPGEPPVYDIDTMFAHVPRVDKGGFFQYMAFDPTNTGRLLVSDGNKLIWEIPDVNVPEVTLFAGDPSAPASAPPRDGPRTPNNQEAQVARFSHPRGLCVDPWGNVWVADMNASTVRVISSATGYVSTAAGLTYQRGQQDGRGEAARFASPNSLVCLPDGNVLVGDIATQGLRRISCADNCPPRPEPPTPRPHPGPKPPTPPPPGPKPPTPPVVPPASSTDRWMQLAAVIGASITGALLLAGITVWSNAHCRRRILWLHEWHGGPGGRGVLGAAHLLPATATLSSPLVTDIEGGGGGGAQGRAEYQHLMHHASDEGHEAGSTRHGDTALQQLQHSGAGQLVGCGTTTPLISLPQTPVDMPRAATPAPLIQPTEDEEEAVVASAAAAVAAAAVDHVVHGAAGKAGARGSTRGKGGASGPSLMDQ